MKACSLALNDESHTGDTEYRRYDQRNQLSCDERDTYLLRLRSGVTRVHGGYVVVARRYDAGLRVTVRRYLQFQKFSLRKEDSVISLARGSQLGAQAA